MKCIIVDDQQVSMDILEKMLERTGEVQVQHKFVNPIEALAFLKKEEIDLIFLDVEMPEMTGLELITVLKDKHPAVVLTTSHADFAVEAFQYNVDGYLMKPVKFDLLLKAIEKIKAKLQIPKALPTKSDDLASQFFVKVNKAIVSLKFKDVQYVECIGDYVTIMANAKSHIVHSTMKSIEDKLPDSEFLRIHRSYIIRLDKIEAIEDDSVKIGGKYFPIGKTYRTDVYKRLGI